jgi:hypothetical protein
MEDGGGLMYPDSVDGEFRTRANLDRAMESPRRER